MTLDCVRPIQSSDIQIIYCNVGLKCFFLILSKCLLAIIVVYALFIYILQGNLETYLQYSGMCNNLIIANCPQSVPVKKF